MPKVRGWYTGRIEFSVRVQDCFHHANERAQSKVAARQKQVAGERLVRKK
jgi:transposase